MVKQNNNIGKNIEASEVTQDMIDTWKAQYEEVHKLTVDDKVAYVRNPDRKTLSYASLAMGKDNLKFGEIILKKCWLAGDLEIQHKDSYFLSANAIMEGIIKQREAKLEKL